MIRAIARRRLGSLLLLDSPAPDLTAAVRALGAVQAQDYPAARWALGLRVAGATDADVERAFDAGAFLRTHVLRPTWHFVVPADIRWLLALTAPRVHVRCAPYYRQLEIDDDVRARSRRALARALRGGRYRTRAELGAALARAGIPTDARRLAMLAMAAELDAVICSGPRRGNQFTYALLDERVPAARKLTHDEALAELARRYFVSHGPATVNDFAWWSGLTITTCRHAIGLLGNALASERAGGLTYWRGGGAASTPRLGGRVHLLPIYDEYLVAYRDREAVPFAWQGSESAGFANPLVIDGAVAGRWRRRVAEDGVRVEVWVSRASRRVERERVEREAARYGVFVGRTAEVAWRGGRP